MQKAWRKIEDMIAANMEHNRKHFRLGDVNPVFVLGQAVGEMKELMDAPDDRDEMADLLGILIHYCIKQGWSMDDIEQAIIDKLDKRFMMPVYYPEVTA